MAPAPLTHAHRARGVRTLVALGLAWGALVAGMVLIDMHPWIAAFLALFTLPAAIDAVRDQRSALRLDAESIAWSRGGAERIIPLAEITEARIRVRLDLSQKTTLVLADGDKVPIPPDCQPRGDRLERALKARDVRIVRSVFG